MTMKRQIEDLRQELVVLRQQLEELERNLPRHSVPPTQLIRIEELQDAISEREKALAQIENQT